MVITFDLQDKLISASVLLVAFPSTKNFAPASPLAQGAYTQRCEIGGARLTEANPFPKKDGTVLQ